jgi:hypothetical protein
LLRTGLNWLDPDRYRFITVWSKALPAVEVIPFPMFLAVMGRVLDVVCQVIHLAKSSGETTGIIL